MTRSPRMPDDLVALARTLLARPRDLAALDQADARIAAGAGADLFAALLDLQREPEGEREPALVATWPLLESMMQARVAVGGYLMARLFAQVRQRPLHHITDGIELWMHHLRDDALAAHLDRLAAEGAGGELRAHYARWADQVRGR